MLTFEQQPVQGADGIVEKLVVCYRDCADQGSCLRVYNLPFQQVIHQVATKDAQPSAEDGIIVMVTGALQVRSTVLAQCRYLELVLTKTRLTDRISP